MQQDGTDNMEHDINALRMEIDNISQQGQQLDADEDVSYVYFEKDSLHKDIPQNNNTSNTLELIALPNDSGDSNIHGATNNSSDYPPDTTREMREIHLRNALRVNKEYQDFLNVQLRRIEMELQRNQEMQKKYRVLVAQKEKPPKHRAPASAVPRRIPGNPYFVDQEGLRPPDNKDTIELKPELEKTALMHKFKKWSKNEITTLAQAIRKQNSEQMFGRLLRELEAGRITHDRFDAEHAAIRRIPEAELEANVEDIDWEEVASVVGSSRSAADCRITWINGESPLVNRMPWTKEEDTKLVKIAKKYHGFNWETVAKELGTHRVAVQCLRRYQRNLNTNITKTGWTAEEDAALAEAVKKAGVGNWQQVASHLVGRTGQQCLHRWDKTLRPTITKGRWSEEEDRQLLAAVELVGSTKSWIKISQHVTGRTDMQCRERWVNVLNPDLNRNQWTADEDERLKQAIAMYGLGKWSQVATVVASRTDNQCWRRWKSCHPDVLDDYREAVGIKPKRGRKKKDANETPVEETALVPVGEVIDEQELKRVAKRRKIDSKNMRKASKALSDGIQSALEPEEPIRVFLPEQEQPQTQTTASSTPTADTQFSLSLEPVYPRRRGRPSKRDRLSFPPATSASPAPPASPAQTGVLVPATPVATPGSKPPGKKRGRKPKNKTPDHTPEAPAQAPAQDGAQLSLPAQTPEPIEHLALIPLQIPDSPAQSQPQDLAQSRVRATPATRRTPARRKRRIVDEDEDEDEIEIEYADSDSSLDESEGTEPDEFQNDIEGEEEEEEGEERRGRAPESTLPVVFPSPALYVALYRLFMSLETCKNSQPTTTTTTTTTTTSTTTSNNNNDTTENNTTNTTNTDNNFFPPVSITNLHIIETFKSHPEFKLLAAWFNSLFLCSLLVLHEATANEKEAAEEAAEENAQ